MKKPQGIALDAKHKEIYIADMTLNAILGFYFPEIFRANMTNYLFKPILAEAVLLCSTAVPSPAQWVN
jgi:hypothetical protein